MPDAVESDNKLGYVNNNPEAEQNITILNPINVTFLQETSASRMVDTGIKLANSTFQTALSVDSTGMSSTNVGKEYDFNSVKNWEGIKDWQNTRSFYSSVRENIQSHIGEPGLLSKQEVETRIQWERGPYGAQYKYKNGVMLYEHQEVLSEIEGRFLNKGERLVEANTEIEFEPVGYSSDGKIEYQADKSLNVDAKSESQNRHYSWIDIIEAALLLSPLGLEAKLIGALGFGLKRLSFLFKGQNESLVPAELLHLEGGKNFIGTLKGKSVELPGVKTELINYTKRNPTETAELRKLFNNTERKKFLQGLSKDVERLKNAGLSDTDIARMKDGIAPKGWQVHHRIPLDAGGTNAMDNLVLINNDPYHKVITNYQNASTKGLLPGETKVLEWPIPKENIYPPGY